MTFGDNILSQDPVDWSVIGGSMSTSSIVLNAGGSATMSLYSTNLSTVPDQFYVSIIASDYTDPYNPNAYVVIAIQTDLNYYEYSAPLVDTGNGYCTIIVPVEATEFVAMSFSIRSDFAVTITDWVLAIPLTDEATLEDIKEEIPKILDDYNTAAFTVQQEEVTIGFITLDLLENTDMNGHFLLTYTSNAAAILTLRIKDNEITELYTPILYNIVPGRNSIGIPHAYVRKLAGIHTLAVTAQVDTGTIYIVTRGMLFTIDGGHLAKRLIDIDVNITDMTMRQRINEVEPSIVYAVGIEDEMARVRIRSYKAAATAVWEPIYEVGPAILAAIEFNGSWIERTTDFGYTIITEDVPWVFWIDPDNILYGQRGTVESTKIALDTGVSFVSAVRGFKSYLTPESDQGLVVLYIKDGKVYYRSYATQSSGVTIWEVPVEVTIAGTGVTSAYISRLNDYRLALTVCSASGKKLYHTERTFAGQAFKSDRVVFNDTYITSLRFDEITRLYPTNESRVKIIDASISFQYDTVVSLDLPILTYFEASADYKTIEMLFDCNFYGIDIIDVSNVGISPSNSLLSIEHIAENTLRMTFANAVNTASTIQVTFAGTPQAGYLRNGPMWFSGVIWVISFGVPAPYITDELVTLSDSTIASLQYSEITNIPAYVASECACIQYSYVYLDAFYNVGSMPI